MLLALNDAWPCDKKERTGSNLYILNGKAVAHGRISAIGVAVLRPAC